MRIQPGMISSQTPFVFGFSLLFYSVDGSEPWTVFVASGIKLTSDKSG